MIDHPLCRPTEVRCAVDARAGIGEGTLWSPAEQALWWVEILEKRLHRHDPATGANVSFDLPGYVGCAALNRSGGLMLALQQGFTRFNPATGALDTLPGTAPPEPGARYNDGVVTPEGRMLATTMPITPPFDDPDYSVHMLGHDGRLSKLTGDLKIGNGLAFSLDGKTMYLSDSHPSRSCIWAFDWDGDDGVASNRRVFFDARDLPGHPDGAAIDAEGYYWYAASYGWSVVRVSPDGKLDRIVPMPAQKPTKPAFGGPNLDTIYVTSIGTNLAPGTEHQQPHGGGVFAFEPGVTGTPSTSFRDDALEATNSLREAI